MALSFLRQQHNVIYYNMRRIYSDVIIDYFKGPDRTQEVCRIGLITNILLYSLVIQISGALNSPII